MRRFLKWVPVQTVGLTLTMIWLFFSKDISDLALLGETPAGVSRALHAASAQLGHFDGGHITNNLVLFVLVGWTAELLVSRFAIPALFVLCAIDSYLFDTGWARYAGFSGVAYAVAVFAGVALGARAVVLWNRAGGTTREDVEMFAGGTLFLVAFMMTLIEVLLVLNGGIEGVNHGSHLRGAAVGGALALVGFVVPEVRAELSARKARARRIAEWRARATPVQLGL